MKIIVDIPFKASPAIVALYLHQVSEQLHKGLNDGVVSIAEAAPKARWEIEE